MSKELETMKQNWQRLQVQKAEFFNWLSRGYSTIFTPVFEFCPLIILLLHGEVHVDDKPECSSARSLFNISTSACFCMTSPYIDSMMIGAGILDFLDFECSFSGCFRFN